MVQAVEGVVPVGQVALVLHAGNLACRLDGLLHLGFLGFEYGGIAGGACLNERARKVEMQ